MAEPSDMPDLTPVRVDNALEQINRAEIDIQISTAHEYPRSMQLFRERATEMVTLDEETALSCIYRRPVGKEKNEKGQWVEKYAEGMSVRMAEIVGASYGNLRVQAMLIEQTPTQVKARGVAHDLESNFAASSEVVESTVDRNGKPYSERMRTVVAKATLAKARRDAIFQVVPRALCKTLEAAARATAIGDAITIEKRRAGLMEWINKLGVHPSRVWAALGVDGIDDIGVPEFETLVGIRTAIKEGDTTPDDAFPPETQKPIEPPKKKEKKAEDAPKEKPAPKVEKPEPAPEREPGQDDEEPATQDVGDPEDSAPLFPEDGKKEK